MRFLYILLTIAIIFGLNAKEADEYKRALRFRAEGKSGQAILILKKINKSPKRNRLMASLYIDGDRFPEAISILETLCIQLKDASCYNELATSYMIIGKYKSAEKSFLNAIENDKTKARYWSNLALVKVYLNNYGGAEKDYNYALKLSPENENTLINKAILILLKKKYQLAETQLRSVLKANANLFMAELYLGVSLLKQGKPLQALEHLENGIDLNPFYFDLYYYRAKARMDSGALDLALLDLELADRVNTSMRYKTDAIRTQIKGFRR